MALSFSFPKKTAMKKILLPVILIMVSVFAGAQEIVIPNKPTMLINSRPGYLTYNEIAGGIGLGNTSVPFSRSYLGLLTIHSYQINKNFTAGGGTGALFYNGGTLVPLLLDFRYHFMINTFTPYILADGGLLLNFSELNSTRLYINPGIGVRYSFSSKIAVTFSTGFWIQSGAASRDSFIPVRLGMVYKPR